MTTKFNTFSCRLECSHDLTAFIVASSNAGTPVFLDEVRHLTLTGRPIDPLPDVCAEFHSEADLETLRDIMDTCDDLHVARQSLRQLPLKENTLERDYSF